jgi:hypothetical protein
VWSRDTQRTPDDREKEVSKTMSQQKGRVLCLQLRLQVLVTECLLRATKQATSVTDRKGRGYMCILPDFIIFHPPRCIDISINIPASYYKSADQLIPLQTDLPSLPQANYRNHHTHNHVRKHGPEAGTVAFQQRRIICGTSRAVTVRATGLTVSIFALNTKRNNLAHSHAERQSDLSNSVEHGSCKRLCFLRHCVAHNDEADGEEDIVAERCRDLRPEGEVPVIPCRIEKCHGEGRERADDT